MPSYAGIFRARVASTADPMGARRIQVTVPDVLGQSAIWAMLCAPFGGAGGAPPAGSGVWVMFERGDPQYPVVMGAIPPGGG